MNGISERDGAEIARRAARRLAGAGLDLLRPFDAARYNRAIEDAPELAPLPLFGRAGALALLLGNTRVLWPRFLDAYRAREELRRSSDPLDAYVADVVATCARELGPRAVVRLAHDRSAGLVSMLRAAEASGLAHRGPVHLAVHPEHGPWFGLRAVIALDAPPPAAASKPAPDPCAACSAPCREAFERALLLAARSPDAGVGAPSSWHAWVEVRDACPVGRASRYTAAQTRYHYTKDRSVLEREAAAP